MQDIAMNLNRLEQTLVQTLNDKASYQQCGDADNIKIKRNNHYIVPAVGESLKGNMKNIGCSGKVPLSF